MDGAHFEEIDSDAESMDELRSDAGEYTPRQPNSPDPPRTKRPIVDQVPLITFSALFSEHAAHLKRLAVARKGTLGLRVVTRQDQVAIQDNNNECVTHSPMPSDRFVGDARLRSVNALLKEIDCRG